MPLVLWVVTGSAARSANDTTFSHLNGVQTVQLDLNSTDTIASAFHDVDKLFLLTPFQPNMVDLTSNLVNVAKNAKVKHIVKLSVMGADAEPGITPSRLHRQAEKILEEFGIPFTFLRPNFFMQNFVNFFIHTIKSQNAFYVPAGDGQISMVDVRDIASVASQVLTSNDDGGKAYNITGGEALSYYQVAEVLSREVGKKISYVNISDEDARKGMKDAGADEWTINSMIELFGIIRASYAATVSPTVEQITGNRPISFNQFAKDNAAHFK